MKFAFNPLQISFRAETAHARLLWGVTGNHHRHLKSVVRKLQFLIAKNTFGKHDQASF